MKRVVDLDRRESLGVIPQHLLLWKLFRVETSFPFFETVATGADEEAHFLGSAIEILR